MYQTTVMDYDRAETYSEEVLTNESALFAELEGLNDCQPSCFDRILFKKRGNCQWQRIKQEIMLSMKKEASLFIFFHSVDAPINYTPTTECICKRLNKGCPMITLNDRMNVENNKKMSVLYIPSTPELYINAYYYFKTKPINENYQVAAFNYRDQKDTSSLLNHMIYEIIGNNLRNVCLIFLGKLDCLYNELIYFARCLKNSDQTRQIPVIGGVMSELMICDGVTCRCKVNGIILAIKGFFMKAWSLSLDVSCNTEEKIRMKYVEFKNRIQLQRYSFGYMLYCRNRSQSLINLEKRIFKETFPTVDLFTIHGSNGYAGDDLNEIFHLYEKIYGDPYSSMSSHIMLITYH